MFNGCFARDFDNMVTEWKERGHEEKYHQVSQDLKCVNVLRNYGLLKFFWTIGLRAQNKLLHYTISLWDVDKEIFIIGDQELELEVANIYIITGLSRRAERIQLFRTHRGGESTSALIRRHFPGEETKMSGKVKIMTVDNLPLRMILHTMAHIAKSQALHYISKSQF